jgi:CRISPR/Cas system CMR subunit Cmr6 (Cas7 group RAMP superfamily)
MKKRNDKQFYNIHKMCFDCVIDKETQLKKEGKWEEYQKEIKEDEIENKLKEFKTYVEERLKESNDGFVSESGEVEKWVGKLDKDRVNEYVKQVEEYLRSLED